MKKGMDFLGQAVKDIINGDNNIFTHNGRVPKVKNLNGLVLMLII